MNDTEKHVAFKRFVWRPWGADQVTLSMAGYRVFEGGKIAPEQGVAMLTLEPMEKVVDGKRVSERPILFTKQGLEELHARCGEILRELDKLEVTE